MHNNQQVQVEELVKEIKKLKKTKISKIINKKISQFKHIRGKKIFSELCFCILTANFNAEKALYIQEHYEKAFFYANKRELSNILKRSHHRFPNTRADYIIEARRNIKLIIDLASKTRKSLISSKQAREWLVKNIKGLGYKEASHFLRNIGVLDVAIIDFHILDLLERYNLIKRPKSLTKTKYIEIENKLFTIAKTLDLTLGELDLYLWFMETGKVVK